MGTVPWTVYAPTRQKEHWTLPDGLDWKTVQLKVRRLQERIASRRPWMAGDDCETGPKGAELDAEHNAVKLKKYRKVQSLQWLMTHSFHAKLLAVKRVTSNKGKNTPGVDGVVLKTSPQKMDTVKHLQRRGYKASPLRRVYIPKKSGKLRPLGIPTMQDRAMQALYALSLKPIAETLGDPYSYGFREGRSCADALRHCFDRFCKTTSPEWVLEADIAGCFDNISHKWILENIPVDKKILAQWLNAGFLDKGELFPTLKGTPQGGIISPVIMNMTLDGLENAVRNATPYYAPGTKSRNSITVIRYADDFIVTSRSRELLEQQILPAIKRFLAERGLTLSEEKTQITNIYEGFDFLGQQTRKFKNGQVLTTPSRKAVQGLQQAVRQILKELCVMDNWSMIRRLNQMIQGWCNYHPRLFIQNILNV